MRGTASSVRAIGNVRLSYDMSRNEMSRSGRSSNRAFARELLSSRVIVGQTLLVALSIIPKVREGAQRAKTASERRSFPKP